MKSKLSFLTVMIQGANLGNENPLPDIQGVPDVHNEFQFDESIPREESKYFNYGRLNSILPYRKQDGYDRCKEMRQYEAAVLENDYLYAVFFPQFGGKLWTLYDKKSERHLVQSNPVFQPCNLALRNGWTSGGVEWNFGTTGHTYFTLSPLHTAQLQMSDGAPVLRMYEWERIRRVTYQIDAYLPDSSRFLFVRIRLCNTSDTEMPAYWWSNTAVYETPDTRVIAPADKAFKFDYNRVIKKVPVPMVDGNDSSYTTRIPYAMDMFYDIPDDTRKWEAALDGTGEGLIQTSTDRLHGRKLFMWGNSPGGKRWQEFLSSRGQAYLEIQAGLAHTQMEHVPIPPGEKWEWLEAYGYMKADPEKVHGEWKEAYMHIGDMLEKTLPRAKVDSELARIVKELDVKVQPRSLGSGWGALELIRVNGGECFNAEAALFAKESLGNDQKPWMALLNEGALPEINASEQPAAYLMQEEWLPLLKESIETGKGRHWHAWLQLGVMYCASKEYEKAEEAFEASFAHTPNGWAKRNLAALKALEGKDDEAAGLLLEAASLLSDIHIAIECGRVLLKTKRFDECEAFCNNLPEALRGHGRIQLILAQAAVETGDFATAEAVLASDMKVYDIREGEVLLSDIWVSLYTRKMACEKGVSADEVSGTEVLTAYPIPEQLDFRMRV